MGRRLPGVVVEEEGRSSVAWAIGSEHKVYEDRYRLLPSEVPLVARHPDRGRDGAELQMGRKARGRGKMGGKAQQGSQHQGAGCPAARISGWRRGGGRHLFSAVVLLLLGGAINAAQAEPIFARELVYKPYVPRDQAKVIVVVLELYAAIPEELEADLAGQRELRETLSRIFDRAYPSFYRAGWQARRPRTETRQELVHERVRVEVDRRRKGDSIVYHNQVCDPDDLFNQKKYREGQESFTEYWDGLARDIDRCLRERFGVR
jgi:hypothetical protein